MGKADRNGASPADVWLPEEVKSRSPERRNGDATTANPAASDSASVLESPGPPRGNSTAVEHVPAKPGEENQAKATAVLESQLEEAEQALAEQRIRIAELEATLEQREAELKQTLEDREAEYAEAMRERTEALGEREAELERLFDQRQATVEGQLEELEARLDVREAEVREQAKRREEELQSRIEELESALKEAPPAAAEPARRHSSPGEPAELDINDVTFEQLRELGLSVTQSARVIAYRDTHQGFESLDQLDAVPGLPAEMKRDLKNRLQLA